MLPSTPELSPPSCAVLGTGQAFVKSWVSLTHCQEACLLPVEAGRGGGLFPEAGRTLDFPLLSLGGLKQHGLELCVWQRGCEPPTPPPSSERRPL